MDKISVVDSLLKHVYGDWHSPCVFTFPKAAKIDEAGVSMYGSRRYLWTDAFGILNFISQSKATTNSNEKDQYLGAAKMLINSVFQTLGNPRDDSDRYPMCPVLSENKKVMRYKGLRIGKVSAMIASKGVARSDMGMEHDGMYWHYIDKMLYALSRYVIETHDLFILKRALHLIIDLHPAFFIPHQGYLWKINTDCTPISTHTSTSPNHDAVSAWIMYNIINNLVHKLCSESNHNNDTNNNGSDGMKTYILSHQHHVTQAIADLTPIVAKYFQSSTTLSISRETSDSLGLGCHLFTMQWCRNADVMGGDALRRYKQTISKQMISWIEHSGSIDAYHAQTLFREYGGLLGCQLISSDDKDLMDKNMSSCIHQAEERAMRCYTAYYTPEQVQHASHHPKHSSINMVMLGSCIQPIAFRRSVEDDGTF